MAVLKLAHEAPVVEIVVPVYNEAADLERSIRRLDAPGQRLPNGPFGGGPGAFGGPPGGPGNLGVPPSALGSPAGPGGAAAAGGLLDASTPGSDVVSLLTADAGRYKWVAAVVGANSAAGYQLASGDAVMAIGGFNGTDPTPSLADFQAAVQKHQVHYFISGGRGGAGAGPAGGRGQSSQSSAITAWVQNHYTGTTADGITLYDLTANPSA